MTRLLLLFIILYGCNPGTTNQSNQAAGKGPLPYNLSQANEIFNLQVELNEISGLSFWKDNKVLAINDELGTVYTIDIDKGKIYNSRRFHKVGDYEAITSVGDDTYIAKSNGNIYKLHANGRTETFETKLSKRNDIEGMCYHKKTHSLLLALKGHPNINDHSGYVNKQAIYRFDLASNKLIETPFMLINNNIMSSWYINQIGANNLDNMAQNKINSRVKRFSPSGIDIHPLTGEIYLLSSRGTMLLVIDENVNFKALELLDINQHHQPEGLCFDDKGNLYISNEGETLGPRIYKYKS